MGREHREMGVREDRTSVLLESSRVNTLSGYSRTAKQSQALILDLCHEFVDQ